MQSDVGSTGEGLNEAFLGTVGGLTQGDLTFPAPFDAATSAALAANVDSGVLAQRLFEVTASRDCAYRVVITALTASNADQVQREIVNTAVASTQLLFTLLETVMDELETRLADQPASD